MGRLTHKACLLAGSPFAGDLLKDSPGFEHVTHARRPLADCSQSLWLAIVQMLASRLRFTRAMTHYQLPPERYIGAREVVRHHEELDSKGTQDTNVLTGN